MTASEDAPLSVPGECVVSRWRDLALDRWVLRIDRADPWIRITKELLDELTEQGWVGEGLFKIEADNGTVRYALRIHNKPNGTWVAERISEWPSTPTNAQEGT